MKTNLLLSAALFALSFSNASASQTNVIKSFKKPINLLSAVDTIVKKPFYEPCKFYTADTLGKDSISGMVYNMPSSKARKALAEDVLGGTPAAGVLVTIYNNYDVKIATTFTNSTGYFRINKLRAGTYKLVSSKNNYSKVSSVILDGDPSTTTTSYLNMSDAITGSMNDGEELNNQFALYPTMVKDFVIIDLGSLPKTDELINISLVSSQGKVVINNNYTGNSLVEISTIGLESGNYIVRISKGKILGIKKFIKVD